MSPSTSFSEIASRRTWLLGAGVVVVIIILAIVIFGGSSSTTTDSDGKPIATLSPSQSNYKNLQRVDIAVGANHYFAPYSRIIIIECANPGGSTANLPTSDMTCDGNTVIGHSVLVHKDGSFSTPYFQMYSLPNAELGEAPNQTPVCNESNQCVLYIGQDQTNFRAPKIFSSPFTVTPPATGKERS